MARQVMASFHNTSCCSASAAVCTSAQISTRLDTAAEVVSIFVISQAVNLRVRTETT